MIKFVFILTTVLISIAGAAQNQISLQDAINVALQNNYQIQITKLQAAQNGINNTWGEAGRYPSITLTGSQGNNISDQSQNPTAFIQELLISNSLQGGLDLNWMLFNGFSVKANKERLDQVEAQSEGNAAIVIENTIQAVVLGYYNVQLQADKLVILKEVLQTSKDRYAYNEIKQEIGTAVSTDLLQFKNQVLTDSSNTMMQEIAVKNARRNLNVFMGVDSDKEYELSDDLFEDFPDYVFTDLKTKMEANNQNLKNQYINSEIFKQDVQLAKSTMFPVVSFNAGASVSNSAYRIGDFPSQSGTNINYYGNFSLSFTLFNGGKVKRAIQAADIQTRITELQVDELKQTLNRDLLNVYELYVMRQKIYSLNKEAVAVARKSLIASKGKYEAGIINSFNFRDVNIAYLNAGISTLESLYNLVDSKTELTRLTGGLVLDSSATK
ncbi:MAG: outer membrane protein [Parvicellaceae bacterium]|jgi:outer membrane protein